MNVLLASVLLCSIYGVFASDEAVLSDLREEMLRLTEVTDSLQRQLDSYRHRNEQLEDTVKTLQQKLDTLDQHRSVRQLVVGSPEPEIAFMATASVDEQHLHIDQPIVYDLVITNIGNAYSPATGMFHCPVSGTYLFNFNIMAAGSDYVEGSLMVNGNHIVHALSDHKGDSTSWDMGTTNIIIRLQEGDVVSVGKQWPNGENTIHGNKFNTFSGYLLRAV